MNKGQYKIIRIDGTEEFFSEKPKLSKIKKEIGCESIDTVILTWHKGQPLVIMLVDDTGKIDNKPVNPKATEFYHNVCKPGTVWSIHGDVAIVNDGDFG